MSRSGAGPRLSIAPTAPQLTKCPGVQRKNSNSSQRPGMKKQFLVKQLEQLTIARNFISASISRHVTAPHFFA